MIFLQMTQTHSSSTERISSMEAGQMTWQLQPSAARLQHVEIKHRVLYSLTSNFPPALQCPLSATPAIHTLPSIQVCYRLSYSLILSPRGALMWVQPPDKLPQQHLRTLTLVSLVPPLDLVRQQSIRSFPPSQHPQLKVLLFSRTRISTLRQVQEQSPAATRFLDLYSLTPA